MFSIACTATARSNYCAVLFRQQLARRAGLTSDASSSSAAAAAAASHGVKSSGTAAGKRSRRLVISRRAWQSFREKNVPPPKQPGAGPKKPKEEERPWPRSVRIGGTVAGGVLVPYTLLWLVTSNPTLRDWLGPFLPMDRLRTHYGHLEWDVQSYTDEMMMTSSSSSPSSKMAKDRQGGAPPPAKPIVPEYYQFPQEAPFRVRKQQELIDAMEGSDVKVTVLLSESDGHHVQESLILPGSTTANARNVISLLKGSSSDFPLDASSSTSVALDFEDDEGTSTHDRGFGTEGFHSASSMVMTDQPSQEDAHMNGDIKNNHAAPLLRETQTFSTWYHVHTQGDPQESRGGGGGSTVNDAEVEISRLEYVIGDLEKNLKDPNCTRDIDEMVAELRQSKRNLSALKWRRRLGLKR
jgi:hypothetical protein